MIGKRKCSRLSFCIKTPNKLIKDLFIPKIIYTVKVSDTFVFPTSRNKLVEINCMPLRTVALNFLVFALCKNVLLK